jgi:hypothetical protein
MSMRIAAVRGENDGAPRGYVLRPANVCDDHPFLDDTYSLPQIEAHVKSIWGSFF